MSTLLLIFIHYGNVIGEQQESGELQVSYSIYKPEILGWSKQIDRERDRERKNIALTYINLPTKPSSFTGVYPLTICMEKKQQAISKTDASFF